MKKSLLLVLLVFPVLFLCPQASAWQSDAWLNGKWGDDSLAKNHRLWRQKKRHLPGLYQMQINYMVHFRGLKGTNGKQKIYEWTVYPEEKNITTFAVTSRGLLVVPAHYFDHKMLLKYFYNKILSHYPYPRINIFSLEIKYNIFSSYKGSFWPGGFVVRGKNKGKIIFGREKIFPYINQAASIVYIDNKTDIALIKLKNIKNLAFWRLRSERPGLYESFTVLHYSSGHLFPIPATIKYWDAKIIINGQEYQVAELAAPCQTDSPGSPLVDENREVCGMITSVNGHMTFAIKAWQILAAMRAVNAHNR